MCGIIGVYNKTGKDEWLREAADTMSHRGPDASDYYSDPEGKLYLGHRRLSVIDLSINANQPMHSLCGRYVMVYNGEIYNTGELRSKLPGHSWRTHSDSEVILELFSTFGEKSFSWLNGMFALSIYDKLLHKLTLTRDQIGIKPIFYYRDEQLFIFASEIKAIIKYLQSASIQPKVNSSSIPYFLHLGFVPEPDTIFEGISKFPAAHYATYKNCELDFVRYWDAEHFLLSEPVNCEKEAFRQYKNLVFDAVNRQMISDVPLGTLLSGGIDSSLVTAIASSISPKRINTFSIGFQEENYDESAYALSVASHLKTTHHTFKVSVDDVLQVLPSLLNVYDEPFADSSSLPTMLVSRLAKTHVTVVLSGDGGDELFQGYGSYIWANRLSSPLFRIARKPLFMAGNRMGNRYKRAGAIFNYPANDRKTTHIFSQEQYFFSEQELEHLLTAPIFDFNKINSFRGTRKIKPSEKQAFWDLENYLKDDLLVKIDRASMHYSLETRVPLLDTKMVEFALNLDYNMKVQKSYGTKYLEKKVLYELVPRKIFDRPKKGFSVPLGNWLLGPLNYLMTDFLCQDIIEKYKLVNYKQVKDLVNRFQEGEVFLYNRIWALIVLHWWMEKYTEK